MKFTLEDVEILNKDDDEVETTEVEFKTRDNELVMTIPWFPTTAKKIKFKLEDIIRIINFTCPKS